MEIRLKPKDGIRNTFLRSMDGDNCTSPTCVTFSREPFGNLIGGIEFVEIGLDKR
jgi:hypothetical protein